MRKRKKLKPKTTSQTLTLRAPTPPPSSSEDMAPLDSDSELAAAHKKEAAPPTAPPEARAPGMTRALLRQKDLEDGVIWEGHHRTSVTEERASIALTSLFTLMVGAGGAGGTGVGGGCTSLLPVHVCDPTHCCTAGGPVRPWS